MPRSALLQSAMVVVLLEVFAISVASAGIPFLPLQGVWPYASSQTSETWSGGSEFLLLFGHGTTLQIADVADPTDITILGEVDASELVHYIDISQDGLTAAVSGRQGLVTLIDVSNRSAPVILGRHSVGFGRLAMGLDFGPTGSDRLYVLAPPAGMEILDTQDPSAPVLLGEYIELGTDFVFDIEVLGNYAFLADDLEGITAIDVSDPTMPTLSARNSTHKATHIAIDGSRAYVSGLGAGLHLYDLDVSGSPAVITPRGSLDLGTLPAGYGVIWRTEIASNGRAIAADSELGNGILVIDVSDPDNPLFEDSLNHPLVAVSVLGTTAFGTPESITFGDPRLRSFDVDTVTNPSAPLLLDSIELHGDARDVSFSADSAVVSAGNGGFVLLDISDIENPVERSRFRFAGDDILASVLAGDSVVAVTGSREVQIVDVSTPVSPVLMTPFSVGGTTSNVVRHIELVAGTSTVLVPAAQSGLHLVDLSDPGNPLELGRWIPPVDALVQRVSHDQFEPNLVAVSGFDPSPGSARRIWLIDISSPALPVEVGSFLPGTDVEDLHLHVGRVFVAAGIDGLRIWDVGTPSAPQELGSFGVAPGTCNGVKAFGSRVYLANDAFWGLQVVGVLDPMSPLLLETVDTTGRVVAVDYSVGRLVIADEGGGVRFWALPGPGQILSDGFESGDTTEWSSASP